MGWGKLATVEVFLVRHAIAEPYVAGQPDEERALTAKGRSRFRLCVRGLDGLGVTFERLLHSPLLRAVQTAEELTPLLEGESAVTPLLAQAPSVQLLAELDGLSSAALVGHEPWMSDLLGLLLLDQHAILPVGYKKGAVAWLRGDPRPGGMELVAFLPPRVLVKFGR